MNFNLYVDSTNNISRVEFNVSLPNLYGKYFLKKENYFF